VMVHGRSQRSARTPIQAMQQVLPALHECSMQRRHTVRLKDFDNVVKDQADSHCRDEEADNPSGRIYSHWP